MKMNPAFYPALFAFILFGITFSAVPVRAAGSLYYVAPGGSDLASGDLNHPWQHIQKAAETATAGDTVYVRSGI